MTQPKYRDKRIVYTVCEHKSDGTIKRQVFQTYSKKRAALYQRMYPESTVTTHVEGEKR